MLLNHRQARPITELAQYRAVRTQPVNQLCRASSVFETIMTANMRFAFAWQRTWLRAVLGA